jgi:fucose permease
MAAARAEVDESCPSVLDASRPGGLTSTEQLTCLSDAGAGLERLARSRQQQARALGAGQGPLRFSRGRTPSHATDPARSKGCCIRTLTPFRMLMLFTAINFLNFMDRGIIPGSLDRISRFVSEDLDVRSTGAYVGALQSSFIGGYAVACVVFGRLVHSQWSPFRLMSVGLLIWCAAVALSGLAPNYPSLVAARVLSGVGEASFQTIAPPFIDDRAPHGRRGVWLGIFFVAIPLGTAAGYAVGGVLSNSVWTWRACFLLEAPLMLPLALLCWFVPFRLQVTADRDVEGRGSHAPPSSPASPGGATAPRGRGSAGRAADGADDAAATRPCDDRIDDDDPIDDGGSCELPNELPKLVRAPTFVEELRGVAASRIYLLVVFGYACWNFTVQGLGNFGPAFVTGLGMVGGGPQDGWDCQRCTSTADAEGCGSARIKALDCAGMERSAALAIGATVAAMGLIGTASGGWLLDRLSPADDPPQKLRVALAMLTLAVGVGSGACFALTAVRSPALFFVVLAAGMLSLFSTTSGVNIAIMWSVPEESRPFALGVSTFLMHALGDVPSPALIGWLMDRLVDANDASASRAGAGLRTLVRIIALWLLGALACWGAAALVTRTRVGGWNRSPRRGATMGASSMSRWKDERVEGGQGETPPRAETRPRALTAPRDAAREPLLRV